MIKHFYQVSNHLYRGAAPSIKDIPYLKNMGINKIVSLDKDSGNKIKRACQLLNIQHIIIPIDIHRKISVGNLFKYNLYDLFFDGSNIFVHCYRGRDRTGLLIALYRCFTGWDCREALKEAKELGFGTGLHLNSEHFYSKLVSTLCPNHSTHKEDIDHNAAYDIVSNVNEYNPEFRDYTLDRFEQQSWSPYADYAVRYYPYTVVDKYDYDEQYPNRENYGLDGDFGIHISENTVPQVGQYDQNTQGISGSGPSLVGSGFV